MASLTTRILFLDTRQAWRENPLHIASSDLNITLTHVSMYKHIGELGVSAQVCNPGTREAELEEVWIQGQYRLHSKILSLKIKTKEKKKPNNQTTLCQKSYKYCTFLQCKHLTDLLNLPNAKTL